MRRLLPLFLALAACSAGQAPIKGKVTVAPELLGRAQAPNAVLFVVARDKGGVPVAMKQIVNPRFPCPFELGPEDRVLPGRLRGPFTVNVKLATRTGPDGMLVFDAEATQAEPVDGSKEAFVFLDKALQPAPVMAQRLYLPEAETP